jgi:hypothetical protein
MVNDYRCGDDRVYEPIVSFEHCYGGVSEVKVVECDNEQGRTQKD